MAIKTIDELNEIQSADQNDLLLISTPDGAKKIKASAFSGGEKALLKISNLILKAVH